MDKTHANFESLFPTQKKIRTALLQIIKQHESLKESDKFLLGTLPNIHGDGFVILAILVHVSTADLFEISEIKKKSFSTSFKVRSYNDS